MRDFSLVTEVLEYQTSPDPTSTDPRYLIAGSQNVLIDYQRKVKIRGGLSRLGAANAALTPIRNAWTWNNSTGGELPQRFYNDTLEVYLGTVDTTVINAWTKVAGGWSTTATLRAALWWDTGENIDLQIMIIGDANLYEWNGAVAVVSSITGTTITKAGTTTYGQNRFYTTRNKTVVCVRTGTEYTYTGGESTTTLTGIADTTGLVAGDILVQKLVTTSNKPAASHTNDTILVFENQLVIGSTADNEVWLSKNTSYSDFSYSAPRIAGEGGLLTLDGPSTGLGILAKNLVAFAGRSSIFRANYQQVAVSTTLAETLDVKKLDTGINQGSQNPDCVLSIANSLVYLSYEPALRIIDNPDSINGLNPRTLSNPIKPDFDAENWTNAKSIWAKSAISLVSYTSSKLYILQFIEDADGKVRRYWQAPQIMPIGALAIISNALYGHSNGVPETYLLFDGYSDINSSDEKIPINAIAKLSYRSFEGGGGKNRALLKNFDEYYTEGEITPSTNDLLEDILYEYGGSLQTVERVIDGTDEDILQELVANVSLGQTSLGSNSLGGSTSVPADARKFQVIFEIAREDFTKIGVVFSTNEVDRYWAILAHGPNIVLSRRKNIPIKK
jgi:hypothetical protein